MIALTESYYILTIRLNKSGSSHLSLSCKWSRRHTGDSIGRGRHCLNSYIWPPHGAHWPSRTLSLRSEHMDPLWSFWHKAKWCKDPEGTFKFLAQSLWTATWGSTQNCLQTTPRFCWSRWGAGRCPGPSLKSIHHSIFQPEVSGK